MLGRLERAGARVMVTIEIDEGAVTRRHRSGPALYFASKMPSEPKAVVGIVHGFADHGARYAHVMGALAEHGIGSVAIDLRGHGRSEGTRGYCEHFEEFLDDARELRALVEARANGVPSFLFGHSFGALVATLSVMREPSSWRGLVLSAPFFGLALEVPRLKVLAAQFASRAYPKFALPSGLDGKDMSHDPVKAAAYDSDPLVFGKATARWFTEATAAQEEVFRSAAHLALPLYVAHGTADKVASFEESKRVFDAAGSADKTWDPREGLFHEVLNEPSWKDVLDPIVRWILTHASSSTA